MKEAALRVFGALLQVGADDEGYAVRMKLKHYVTYAHSEEHAKADDSPLYIFDGTFASRSGSRSMHKEYSVPPYFREDLMSLAGEKRRPPYRLDFQVLQLSHLIFASEQIPREP